MNIYWRRFLLALRMHLALIDTMMPPVSLYAPIVCDPVSGMVVHLDKT